MRPPPARSAADASAALRAPASDCACDADGLPQPFVALCQLFSARNATVSSSRNWTNSARPMSTTLSRNGTRQPHAMNAPATCSRSPAGTPGSRESRRPARRPARSCRRTRACCRRRALGSEQHGAAPLPTDRDALHEAQHDQQQRRARRRSMHRMGRQPMSVVAAPIISSATTSAFLRPMRSPKCPKMMPPIGRATKPTANVLKEASSATSRRHVRREERRRKYQRRGGPVEKEVVPLDAGAGERRQRDLADRALVDSRGRHGGLLDVGCHALKVAIWLLFTTP